MSHIDSKQKLQDLLLEKLGDEGLALDLTDKIFFIGNKFEISLREIGEILELVYRVLVGEIHREQFFENLQKIEDLVEDVQDAEELRQIATLIDDEVLSQVKKYIGPETRQTQDQEKINRLKQSLNTGATPQNMTQSAFQNQRAFAPARPAARPEQRSDEIPESTRREIEQLKEKLQRLESRSGEYSPSFSPQRPQPVPPQSPMQSQPKPQAPKKPEEREERFGVEPAKDLGAEDFSWEGNVGGVEIEPNQNADSLNDEEENLDKAQVLEEVENPPAYGAPSALEEKLTSFQNVQTSPAPQASKTFEAPKPAEPISFEEVEKRRKDTYKDEDPYREPIL